MQQSLESSELDDNFRLPGADSPADGLTEAKSDMVPLLRLLESGIFCPGGLRPFRGVSPRQGEGHECFFRRPSCCFGRVFYNIARAYLAAN